MIGKNLYWVQCTMYHWELEGQSTKLEGESLQLERQDVKSYIGIYASVYRSNHRSHFMFTITEGICPNQVLESILQYLLINRMDKICTGRKNAYGAPRGNIKPFLASDEEDDNLQ